MSIRLTIRAFAIVTAAAVIAAAPAFAQHAPASSEIRSDVLRDSLPAGDYRTLHVAVVELAPGAAAPRHRPDVAVVAYVLEGTVENRFDGGVLQTHRVGEA